MLYQYLLKQNIEAVKTREIGGTQEGEKIRDIIIHENLNNISALLLVMAARNEHLSQLIDMMIQLPLINQMKRIYEWIKYIS